jgi:hypothetical protein
MILDFRYRGPAIPWHSMYEKPSWARNDGALACIGFS